MSITCMEYLTGQFVQNLLCFDEYLPKPHSSYPVCSHPLDMLIYILIYFVSYLY